MGKARDLGLYKTDKKCLFCGMHSVYHYWKEHYFVCVYAKCPYLKMYNVNPQGLPYRELDFGGNTIVDVNNRIRAMGLIPKHDGMIMKGGRTFPEFIANHYV